MNRIADEDLLQLFIASAAPLVGDQSRPFHLLAMRDMESERRRDEVFGLLGTRNAPISDDIYFQTVTRYDDFFRMPERSEPNDGSLFDLSFGDSEGGEFHPLLESTLETLGAENEK